MRAFASATRRSAAAISGRRSRSSEGTPTGAAGGLALSGSTGRERAAGGLPIKRAIASAGWAWINSSIAWRCFQARRSPSTTLAVELVNCSAQRAKSSKMALPFVGATPAATASVGEAVLVGEEARTREAVIIFCGVNAGPFGMAAVVGEKAGGGLAENGPRREK